MTRFLSRSIARRTLALLCAVGGFVLLYEVSTFDSEQVASIFGDADAASPGSRLPFSATAYCKGDTTASGVRPRTGVAAADPTLLPVGSVLNVATGDKQYNGVYTVMDTGPEVKGRELDLYIWSCNEALRFGRRRVQVTVLRLGWDPKASSPTLVDRLFRRREASRRIPAPEPPPPASLPAPVIVNETSAAGAAAPAREPGTIDGLTVREATAP
jgi:3D (Asp-Asp-Asp) domain-containing protein